MVLKLQCPYCPAPFQWRGRLPERITCPNCKSTFTPDLKESVDPRDGAEIVVALSGGGHRATLFGLGVLLALVDLGLNREVVQIREGLINS